MSPRGNMMTLSTTMVFIGMWIISIFAATAFFLLATSSTFSNPEIKLAYVTHIYMWPILIFSLGPPLILSGLMNWLSYIEHRRISPMKIGRGSPVR